MSSKVNEARNNMPSITRMPDDLLAAQQLMLRACGFTCHEPVAEPESAEYGAYTFKINALTVKFRVAKITPTKTGQFVTLWKRNGKGPIQPFDLADDIDFVIINCINGPHAGQFIFPASVLYDKGIFSGNNKEGKRAIRVYPPWDIAANRQAQKTQQWQLNYFIAFDALNRIDKARLKSLLL